jgi:hypothetical protein
MADEPIATVDEAFGFAVRPGPARLDAPVEVASSMQEAIQALPAW